MTAHEIDTYLAGLDELKRDTLEKMRRLILSILPEAEQGLSYGLPAFKVGGKPVAGFGAAGSHLSYYPHSGSVLVEMAFDLEGYSFSKGALKFPIDEVLPADIVEKLISARLVEIKGSSPPGV